MASEGFLTEEKRPHAFLRDWSVSLPRHRLVITTKYVKETR